MSGDEFYRGSVVGKFLGQLGVVAQIGAVITLLGGDFGMAGMMFVGGLISMFLGYLLAGGSNNPYLH
jgi:hypothetical protein